MPATMVIFHNRALAARNEAYRLQKAVLEAEHKKAQALTVTRRINVFP